MTSFASLAVLLIIITRYVFLDIFFISSQLPLWTLSLFSFPFFSFPLSLFCRIPNWADFAKKKKKFFTSQADLQICNCVNLLIIILLFQTNILAASDNKVLDDVDIPNNEAELRLVFARQTEELRLVRRQLANSQLRVKELEEQLRKSQSR